MTAARDSAATAEFVRGTVAGLLRVPPERVADDRPFREIGLDSAQLLAMLDAVSTWLGRAVPSWVVWQYPTVAALSAHLTGNRPQPVTRQSVSTSDGESIAIVGIGCRLPGGIDTPEALWAGLVGGIDAVREVPPDRWNAAAWHDPDATSPGRMNTRWGGFLNDVTGFDADLFRISPAEARHMDPQQRIALEVAWAALEDAQILPEDLAGSRTGVFLGVMAQEYHLATGAAATAIGAHSAVGWDNSIIPARIAYFLGLRGPVMAVATACSSSLSALHLAVQSLRRGESDAALAGGVNLMLHPHTTVAMTKFGAMSPDGRCRAFDAGANGYVRGEGCGVVVLRRLADALVAGDRIYAVIRGSAVNNDGASNGLTAPNPEAQVDVLRSAWRDAGIPSAEVSYVEAHGTGTPLGDPIEAAALGAVFGGGRESELLVGSVKTNIGHLEPAAGIAGVLKTALALYHGELPASLHFLEPNPHIDFEANRLRVVTSRQLWPAVRRRLAGVSSFGFGGTNAHVALAEAPYRRPAEPVVPQRDVRDPRPTLGFLFSGHGAQWRGMGRELLGEPVFRAELDVCDRAIHAVTGWSVIEELAAHEGRLDRTEVIQPALFAMQVALARTVRRWGLTPDVVLGQSVGEVAAAVVAGALSLPEGARIITTWSALVAERASGQGTVIVCELPVAEAAALGDRVSVAGHLSPGQVALSGTNDAIAAVERELTEAGVRVQRVDIDYPSHGPLMSALAPELSRRLGEVHRGTASVPFFSTVTGGFVDGAELDARYWVRNMCEPMLLAEAVQALGRKRLLVVEVGPHPVVRRSVERTLGYDVLFTCRRDRPAVEGLVDLAGRLWSDGFDLDWAAVSGRPARTLRAPVCLAVSGKSAAARAENAARLADHLDGREDTEPAVLSDVAYTAATHRSHLEHRGVVVAESVAEAVGGLRALSQDRSAAGVVADAARAGELAVLFTGQGSQWPGMGLALCEAFEVFRREFDEVSAALDVHLRTPLREVIGSSEVHETEFTQPALFAVEVALHRLWRSWGIEPAVVAGHSIGELSAAYVAGVLSLPDVARLVCARGRLMQRCQRGGAMISVEASETEVLAALSEVDGLASVAGLNGPSQTVVSGDEAAVTAIARFFADAGKRTRRLDVSHAFHSAHMDAMLTDFAGVARNCRFHAPRLPMVSTMTGEWMGPDLAPGQGVRSSRYWVRQAREAVRFLDAMHTLEDKGIRRYLECGPSAVLSAMAAGCVEDARFTASLTGDGDEVRALLTALGTLHVTGSPVDWRSVFAGTEATRTDLPTYAFQHQHYWLGEQVADAAGVADWLYERTWQSLGNTPPATVLDGQWAVVVPEDATGIADAVVSALESAGGSVRVLPAADDRTGYALSELDSEVRGVLAFTPLDETPTSPGASRGAARTLALIQALGDSGIDAPLWILTSGGTSRPAQALCTGLGLVAALEHPNRWGGVIDLPEALDPETTRQLLATMARCDPGEHIALRPDGRAARRLRRAGRGVSAPAWRGRGTALITGGSGALAAHLARWLAHRGVEHVVLASRRGAEVALPEELAELRVTRVACDVSDRDQLERLLARLDDDPAPLRSVFHAAGVLDDKLLARMDAASLSAVAAPKTGGAWHLHELTQRHDLDAFVLFSSTAGTLGQVGQANYAMANAGLDALAELRRASGLPAISIGWGPWATGGMASGAAGDALRDTGLIPMPPDAALSGLDIALESGRSLVIAHIDWSTVEDRPVLREIVAGQEREDRGDSFRAALHNLPERERRARLLELLAGEAAAVLGVEQAGSLDPRRGFSDLGFDSMMAIELSRRVGLRTGVATPKTLVFDHPNLEAASAWLLGELSGRLAATPEPAGAGRVDEPLAIVGVGLRLPGNAHDLDSLWEVLAEDWDTLTAIPPERFDVESIYHPDRDAGGRTYVRHAALLDDVATFDAEFFGISPREAEPMDPQHRLLLEVAWNSLEDAGIRPGELRDSATGVFIGAGPGEYGKYRSGANQDTYQLTGSLPSFNAGRLAYHLGLQGPALSVDTACSSSLVALHLASEALRNRECDLALAGGVQVLADPGAFIALCRAHALSPDGRSKTFSSAADGYGRGEGVGVVAVMRLSDALAANRPVYGVIRGTAINHDGASSGITAPNGSAQQKVIRAALRSAGLSTSDIDYVECHGTGTSLGDPIEVQALAAVYGQDRDPQRPIGIGTVKSVIGHLESAAGIAGVCKVLASFRHDSLPATMHSTPRNPNIEWDELPVRVVDKLKPWPRRAEGSRRAGVSSFGLSGTNAHVVLEEPPSVSLSTVDAMGPVLVSGRDERALREQAGRWADWLAEHPDVPQGDVTWTASGRTHFGCRASVLADDPADGLRAVAEGRSHPAVVRGVAGRHGNVVFVYPGQGSQWEGMGRALLAESAVFAAAVSACDAALLPWTGWSVRDVLNGEMPLDRVDVVQPALFAMGIGLTAVWQSLGVEPAAVVGHSQGEVVAAVVSGALTLVQGAKVVALRSQAVSRVSGRGGMALVERPLAEVTELIAPYGSALSIAAVNTATSTVVSGEADAIDGLVAELQAKDVYCRKVKVDYASHNAQMDELLPGLAEAFGDLVPGETTIPFYSTVDAGAVLDGAYWCRNLRETVRFDLALRRLQEDGHGVFVEVSAHPVLAMPLTDGTDGTGGLVVGTLARQHGDRGQLLRSLSQLHVQGYEIDWARVLDAGAVVGLPTYAFQRQRFWLPVTRPSGPPGTHPWLSAVTELANGDGFLFIGHLSPADHPWLADHSVFGSALVPGTGLLELALAAAREVGAAGVAQLTLTEPLLLTEPVSLQVIVGADRSIAIHSRTDGGQWQRHASGVLREDSISDAFPDLDPVGERVELDYPQGLDYGPAFRGLTALWRYGDTAYGVVRLPEGLSAAGYLVHPALLDAALHTVITREVLLPFEWTDVEVYATGGTELRVRVDLTGTNQVTAWITDDAGHPVARIGGLLLRPPAAEHHLYRVELAPVAVPAEGMDNPDRVVIEVTGTVREVTVQALETLRQPGDAELVWVIRELAHAPLRGLLRVARNEFPERSIRLIDVGPLGAAPPVFERALAVPDEPELVVRDGAVLAPRLVRVTDEPGKSRPLDPNGTVLITGGTGELGRLIAAHVVQRHGVRHLVLASRHPEEITVDGADVRVVACDVTSREDLARVLSTMEHPLTAVFHLAGVLDDGLLADLTPERFERVMAPKVDGALHLHELTKDLDLAAFVLFSSAAGILGSLGQANYAAANTFLDALAAHEGRATSIAWGLWQPAGIGMTSHLGEVELDRMRRQGMSPMPVDEALRLLDRALGRPPDCVVAVRLDLRQVPGELPPMLRALVRPAPSRAVPPGLLRDQLLALSEPRRRELLTGIVLREAAVVLGVGEVKALSPQQVLKELGLDSLMAVELRRRLAEQTGATLPATLAFDYPTPTEIVGLLMERLELAASAQGDPRLAERLVERSVEDINAELDAFLETSRAEGWG